MELPGQVQSIQGRARALGQGSNFLVGFLGPAMGSEGASLVQAGKFQKLPVELQLRRY